MKIDGIEVGDGDRVLMQIDVKDRLIVRAMRWLTRGYWPKKKPRRDGRYQVAPFGPQDPPQA